MRTNHRLLRNAQAAIEDLNSGRVKDEHTMHAYLLMLSLIHISPYPKKMQRIIVSVGKDIQIPHLNILIKIKILLPIFQDSSINLTLQDVYKRQVCG